MLEIEKSNVYARIEPENYPPHPIEENKIYPLVVSLIPSVGFYY